MILTYPHIGKIDIFIRAILEELKVDYVSPPPISNRTLELGIKYAPEMACLPLKINLGNFIESIEKGADTVVITGGRGPCRFGYYGAMHREMLRSLGYDVDVIILDCTNGYKEGIRNLKTVFKTNLARLVITFLRAYRLIRKIDNLDRLCYYVRPREVIKGATDKIMRAFMKKMESVKGIKESNKIVKLTREKILQVDIDKDIVPLKVGLVGDIYTLIEPSSNVNIEEMLGNMGVQVDKSLYISKWIKEHLLHRGIKGNQLRMFDKACEPYMHTPIGGHARETIGNTCLYAQEEYDGVIQIYPLTCMPEIVAASILPTISKDYDIPVLTLIIDEMTGEAGYHTRIDSFVDVLKNRRLKKAVGNEYLLSRN